MSSRDRNYCIIYRILKMEMTILNNMFFAVIEI